MEDSLQSFMTQGVFAFILTFVRIGTAVTIMPGVGDSFTPTQVRLYIALGLSLVLSPLVVDYLPNPVPETAMLFILIGMEFIIGLFFGTIARIFMTALDTAGMLISMQSGLGNANLFNPAFSSQGSLIGAFLSISGVIILFAANMHHLLFYGLVGTYEMFPVGSVPDAGSMAEMISKSVSMAFAIGFQLASPFIVIAMMIYVGMGILSRLMPQVQVFMIAMPLQIWISLLTLSIVVSAAMLFWLSRFEDQMVNFLRSAQ